MSTDDLTLATDTSGGEWIAAELTGTPGSVTSVVPNRFDGYVRILHPAETHAGEPVTWAEVAEAVGSSMHACRQWHVLVGSSDTDTFEGSNWEGAPPERGDLESDVLGPLCKILGGHTSDPADCFFGLWIGLVWEAWEVACPPSSGSGEENDRRLNSVSRSVDEIDGPRLELPGREYVLLTGLVSAATQVREREGDFGSGFSPTSPNLMWPADRAWFVASEIDFDSTLVGGSKELIEEIVEADDIEAWPIEPNDSLAFDGDYG
jgi:hypothetical protein